MKISMSWVREWASPKAADRELAARLTLAGLECEAEPLPVLPAEIVVGRVRKVEPHPQADRLRVCAVDVGEKDLLTIVCGASNVRAGMTAPAALPGARLPDGVEIKEASLRGVESSGMLCSARELGLSDKSEGLLELDPDARPGVPLVEHLRLEDALLNLELTPNRGDCLSVAGLAREIAAVYGLALKRPKMPAAKPAIARRYAIKLDSRSDCPRYAGRAIAGINLEARTPDWMRERLRRSGLRCVHPVVDITNYVMLELGQPMHAFDAARISGGIRVRRAQPGETLRLLNEQNVTLAPADLLIADDSGPLALAGIMGGLPSSVTPTTTDIFFESACFNPELVAATGRRLRMASDALYRFERGVDPGLQREALERATQLLLQICGGSPGPVTEAGTRRPKPVSLRLRRARLEQLLGCSVPDTEVERLLKRLGIGLKRLGKTGWQARIPSHRYDLRIEPDLIEEVARLHGYERIPARPYAAQLAPAPVPERESLAQLREQLIARGYHEVITYSFVDAALQQRLTPDVTGIPLDNPMAETLSVMRTTLWSGLIPAWQYNHQRQQKRVRLFEVGVCFGLANGEVVETRRIGGLAAGTAMPEQWGQPVRPVDFFDVKGDVAGLDGEPFRFEPGRHPALHPGQTARIFRGGRPAGWLGVLHPRLVQVLDLPEAPVLFELDADVLEEAGLPRLAPVSEFPASRRDLALVLKEEVMAGTVLEHARGAGGPLLREARVFDVYRGSGLPSGFKSVALGLIFQDNSRTLTDQEVDAAVQAVAQRLQKELAASIRGETGGGVDQGGIGRSAV